MAITFSAPRGGEVDLLVVAGEHSGDQHAGKMLKGLKLDCPDLRVCALGGASLKEAGAEVLWDMTANSVVGFVEVLKHYSLYKALLEETVRWVKAYKPRAICFVDYPGFNLRLAKRLFKEKVCQKAGGDIALYYYIGPQIWAWKGARRFEMAEYLNALAVIFPFEVECYKDTNLEVRFVGHPFLQEKDTSLVDYEPSGPVLLLPGSRPHAISRIFPVMLDAFELLLKKLPREEASVIYPSERIREHLEGMLRKRSSLSRNIALRSNERKGVGKAVLGSSGTMSLHCALAGIPGAVLYRAHPMTYFLGKMLVKVPYLGMANLLLKQEVYPEYLQKRANASTLVRELEDCLRSGERRDMMKVQRKALRKCLSGGDETMNASAWLKGFLTK